MMISSVGRSMNQMHQSLQKSNDNSPSTYLLTHNTFVCVHGQIGSLKRVLLFLTLFGQVSVLSSARMGAAVGTD